MCVQKGTDASFHLRQAAVPDQDSVLGFWQSELRQYAGGPAMLVRETTWTRTPSSSSSWYCWFWVAVDSFTSAAPKTLTAPAERGPNAAATLGPRLQRDFRIRVRKQRSGPPDSAWPFCWPVSRHPSNGLLQCSCLQSSTTPGRCAPDLAARNQEGLRFART